MASLSFKRAPLAPAVTRSPSDIEKVALGRVWNQTGDASLDDSLTLPFRIKMEESPHLHVLSPEKFERASQAAHSEESQSPSISNELAACAARELPSC